MAIAMVAAIALAMAACGGGNAANESAEQKSTPAATATATGGAQGAPDWQPPIRTASIPADPCALMPPADVEAVFGKLAEPPKQQNGCRYTFVLPEAVSANRQKFKAAREKLRQTFGGAGGEEIPEFRDAQGIPQSDPRSYAATISVDVNATVESELAAKAVSRRFGLPAGTEMDKIPTEPASARNADGWDDARSIPYGSAGRVGHVRVTVRGHAPDVPRAPMQVLAARVRDRIPDLPFAVTNPYQVIQLGQIGDPCSLLTRAEVEGVLRATRDRAISLLVVLPAARAREGARVRVLHTGPSRIRGVADLAGWRRQLEGRKGRGVMTAGTSSVKAIAGARCSR